MSFSKKIKKVLVYLILGLLFASSFYIPQIKKTFAVYEAEHYFFANTGITADSNGTFTNVSWTKFSDRIEHVFKINGWNLSNEDEFMATYNFLSSDPIVRYTCYYDPSGGISEPIPKDLYAVTGFTGAGYYGPGGAEYGNCQVKQTFLDYRLANHGYRLAVRQNTEPPSGIIAIFTKNNDLFEIANPPDDGRALSSYIRYVQGQEIVLPPSDAFKSGTFNISPSQWLDHACTDPPEILIPGHTFPGVGTRPAIKFQLKHVVKKTGGGVLEDLFFYFVSELKTNGYDQTVIRMNAQNQGWFMLIPSLNFKTADNTMRIGDSTVTVDSNVWNTFNNRVYNAPGTGGSVCGAVTLKNTTPSNYTVGQTPNQQCVNVSTDGWLKGCWNVGYDEVSLIDGGGEEENACGSFGIGSLISKGMMGAIQQVLCTMILAIGSLGAWLVEHVFKGVFEAYLPISSKIALFLSHLVGIT